LEIPPAIAGPGLFDPGPTPSFEVIPTMNRLCFGTAALAALICAFASPENARAQGYGHIAGQFLLDGEIPVPQTIVKKGDPAVKDAPVCAAEDVHSDELVVDAKSNGIANVFIYMMSKDAKKLKLHPSQEKSAKGEIVFDQKGCRFVPHCLVVRTDQTVVVKSDDAISHNTHGYLAKNEPFNFLVGGNDRKGVPVSPAFTTAETLPMPVKCDIHAWMQAHWLIVDHPYAALTDKEGKFTMENLPEGEHTFRVWHERAGYLNREWKVTVKAGETTKVEPVKVPVATLTRAKS
jgi:hypothetical protein